MPHTHDIRNTLLALIAICDDCDSPRHADTNALFEVAGQYRRGM